MERLSRNNIILIGFMGSGKSSVGKELAKRMGYRFLDTDAVIEQEEGQSIPAVFEGKGEAYFRDRETGLLSELKDILRDTVLSTGGGMPLREQNRNLLRQLGFVVYLKAADATILRRLKGDRSRPLLAGEALEVKVERLQRERGPIYQATAHYHIDTDDWSPRELADRIIDRYQDFIEVNAAEPGTGSEESTG